ncbi:MAG TPA: serine O-acetyltransferase [Clostridiales bacterium]|nr:serine O-acetyltransferase [Clostridiales bacterium]
MLFKNLGYDLKTIVERDPAARNRLEAALLYPGFHAIIMHRLAHILHRAGLKFLARSLSQFSRWWTGIEIHPGAVIGRGLFIDHGMGVVIGETAEIGDNCTIYHGVTLGGTGKHRGKRHPTIGNNVMIGTGAKVLGPFRVGNNVMIGAGSVVLSEVEDDCTVIGIPARVVRKRNRRLTPCDTMDQVHIPDPLSQEICKLKIRLDQIEAEIRRRHEPPGNEPAPADPDPNK